MLIINHDNTENLFLAIIYGHESIDPAYFMKCIILKAETLIEKVSSDNINGLILKKRQGTQGFLGIIPLGHHLSLEINISNSNPTL